ncbi:splicing endonuclease positive effector sen1, putative [Entamoeba dispar SAW760]|uniref:Splicing endonuclease positive effector sen1, putative n=1 Tax=Entamoeba dispar (strain ATCC PRA-260 / SAW760) TaxID=370354 RepID=B0EMP1_ENTDS|nr:splicing endonuclease positive effector sen1, putative [Entamoeba dispar SAW760]EDR24206.1 splicing endonuclease positive effector sen1, putative [Entamoeba dispar SAW760]|eukprot:EDR24206.1 splicing endonuclease positive effector sen1, putative [Entamoeba dispar SAW760]
MDSPHQSISEDDNDYNQIFDRLSADAELINKNKRKYPTESCQKVKLTNHSYSAPVVTKKVKWLEISEHQKVEIEKEMVCHVLTFKYPFNSEITRFDCPPSEFKSTEHYINCFKPILFDEIRATIQKSLIENEEPFVIEGIINKIEITGNDVLLSLIVKREEWGEFDLIVVSNVSFETGTFPKNFPFIIGVVVKKGEEDKESSLTLRCLKTKEQNNLNFFKIIGKGKKVYMRKITSIISSAREYLSLCTIQHLSLIKTLLKPSLKDTSPSNGIFGKYLQTMKETNIFNSSQIECINSALSKKGFSLIQGPPGTGKTKTLLGILGAIIFGKPASINKQGTVKMKHSKILVCAPSNAAVDEIVLRIQNEGILNGNGKKQKVNIIRIGNYAGINSKVNEVLIDTLISNELTKRGFNEQKRTENVSSKIASIEQKMRALTKEIEDTVIALNNEKEKVVSSTKENDKKINRIHKYTQTLKEMNNKRDAFRVTLQQMKSEKGKIQREFAKIRKEITKQIFEEADILCCTLNTSGSDIFLNCVKEKIENVIVDEAAQSVEISTLIPLRFGAERCILIGDPQQLPATVISVAAQNSGYDRSLFERLYKCGVSVDMLKIQYRMHPLIREFPSKQFYSGELIDGRDESILPCSIDKGFGPVVFYDACGGLEERVGQTLANEVEVQIVIGLLEGLIKKYPNCKEWDIGIVTPYRQQLLLIKIAIESSPLLKEMSKLCVNTIDGFQGREMDIIIFSCVRSSQIKPSIGFLSDIRRMNVALTRAKNALWVIGNSNTLCTNKTWKQYIEWLKEKDLIIEINESVIRDTNKYGEFGMTKSISNNPHFVQEKKKDKIFTFEEITEQQEQQRIEKRNERLKEKNEELKAINKEQQIQMEIKKQLDLIQKRERNKMSKRLKLLRTYENTRLEEELQIRKKSQDEEEIHKFESTEREEIEKRLATEKNRIESSIQQLLNSQEPQIRSSVEKQFNENPIQFIDLQVTNNSQDQLIMSEESNEIKSNENDNFSSFDLSHIEEDNTTSMENDNEQQEEKEDIQKSERVINNNQLEEEPFNLEKTRSNFEKQVIEMYYDMYDIENDIENRETHKVKIPSRKISSKIKTLKKKVIETKNEFNKIKGLIPSSISNETISEKEQRKHSCSKDPEYEEKRTLNN